MWHRTAVLNLMIFDNERQGCVIGIDRQLPAYPITSRITAQEIKTVLAMRVQSKQFIAKIDDIVLIFVSNGS